MPGSTRRVPPAGISCSWPMPTAAPAACSIACSRRRASARLDGAHCYEIYAGRAAFAEMSDEEPGTFYLTDFLARNFERLVIQGLGIDRHPELLPMYFGNYTRVVFLAQTDDASLTTLARRGARRLGLRFERRFTGHGELAPAMATFRTGSATASRAPLATPSHPPLAPVTPSQPPLAPVTPSQPPLAPATTGRAPLATPSRAPLASTANNSSSEVAPDAELVHSVRPVQETELAVRPAPFDSAPTLSTLRATQEITAA